MSSLGSLFHWAIENSSPNEERQQQPSELKPVDPRFLNAILRSDADKMKALIQIFQDSSASIEEKEVALEELEFFVQMTENACDLNHPTVNALIPVLDGVIYDGCRWAVPLNPPADNSIGKEPESSSTTPEGKVSMLSLQFPSSQIPPISENIPQNASESMNSKDDSLCKSASSSTQRLAGIRMRCAWVLATALQNNPKVQKEVMELNGLNILLQALRIEAERVKTHHEDADLEVLSKVIYALSGLLNGPPNKEGQRLFWIYRGFSILNGVLKMDPNEFLESSEQQIPKADKAEEEMTEESPQKEDSNVQDSVQQDPNTIVIVDIEEKVKEKAEARKKQFSNNHPNAREDRRLTWMRIVRRIVFFYWKLIVENEAFKLLVISGNSSEKEVGEVNNSNNADHDTFETLIELLSKFNDFDLTEKILMFFEEIFIDNEKQNTSIRKYTKEKLKNQIPLLKRALEVRLESLKKIEQNYCGDTEMGKEESFASILESKILHLLKVLK